MLTRLINGLLHLCCWLERLRDPGETPTMQPYDPVPHEPSEPTATTPRPPANPPVYLHRPANAPVYCDCVEAKQGYWTTQPGCKRCGGLGKLAP